MVEFMNLSISGSSGALQMWLCAKPLLPANPRHSTFDSLTLNNKNFSPLAMSWGAALLLPRREFCQA